MIRNIQSPLAIKILIVSLSSILFTSCGIIPGTAAQPTGESQYESQEQTVLIKLSCPDELTLYSLWLFHNTSLDIDGGSGETFHLEFANQEPSFFDVYIDADGTVSNQDLYREVLIDYQGTANHPGDNDCPVQTFKGTWKMRGTITGTCQNDKVSIHIIEEWVDPVLVSDCTGPISPGSGIYSAPELDLIFNLRDEVPSDSLVIEGGGPFQASYVFYFWRDGYELPLVPLVPGK